MLVYEDLREQLRPHLVRRVEGADDLEVDDGPRREVECLPGPATLSGLLGNHLPLASVHRRLYVITVRAVVAVPQEQSGAGGKRARWRRPSIITTLRRRSKVFRGV